MQIKLTTTGRVTKGRETCEVTAHELSAIAREPAWELAVKRFPTDATYQRKTSRQIPVFARKRR